MQQQSLDDKPFPGIAESLLLIPMVVLGQVAAALVLPNLHIPFIETLASTWPLLGLFLATGVTTMRRLFPHRKFPLSIWHVTLLGSVGIMLVVRPATELMQWVWPVPESLERLLRQFFERVDWATVAIAAPLTEEPLVRGLVLGAFLSRYTSTKAIVASAVLFALIHLNPGRYQWLW